MSEQQIQTGSQQGKIEYADLRLVKGWAADLAHPEQPLKLEVREAGGLTAELSPALLRWDLRDFCPGARGFIYEIPARYRDGGSYQLHFLFADSGQELEGSPLRICAAAESQFVPFQTTSLVKRRVLALAPHPDDESLACGGALILHGQEQDPLKVVFLTDGSRGDFSQQYSVSDYIALRQQEARQAARILGATDLEFWGILDRALEADAGTIDRLAQLLTSYRPTLIYAPSPLEFHPDHRAAALLLWQALQRTQLATEVAFYEYNRPLHVNTLVDISAVIEQKQRACQQYQSQLANYPYVDCATGLNRYRALTVAGQCSYAEGYFLLSSREMFAQPIETFRLKQLLPPTITERAQSPLVSVIIRTKDRLALLREALASLLVQTYPRLEVVVVNDGGEDVSPVIEEFGHYLDIRLHCHEHPRGRAAAANTGLKLARGKYLNFLDDDDLLYPSHIEKLVALLERGGALAAYSDCEIGSYQWTPEGMVLTGPRQPFMGLDFDRRRLYFDNYLPIMTVMFARQLLSVAGGFDESLETFEDWDFWIRLAEHTDFHRAPGVTAEYRVFAQRNYDDQYWREKVYANHPGHSTLNNLVKWAWPKLGALQTENARQQSALLDQQAIQAQLEALRVENADLRTTLLQQQTIQAQLETSQMENANLQKQQQILCEELRLIQHSSPQRLARFLKRVLPRSLTVVLVKSLIYNEQWLRKARSVVNKVSKSLGYG